MEGKQWKPKCAKITSHYNFRPLLTVEVFAASQLMVVQGCPVTGQILSFPYKIATVFSTSWLGLNVNKQKSSLSSQLHTFGWQKTKCKYNIQRSAGIYRSV